MATLSNTCDGTNGYRYYIYLDYNLNSQDIVNNTSNISLQLYARSTGSTWGAYNLSTSNTSTLLINGTAVTSTNQAMDFRNTATVYMASWTGPVAHNPDGTLSITIAGVFNIIGASGLTGGSVSGTWTLPTIPRASQPTMSNFNIGNNVTINTNRVSPNFTHTVSVTFGSFTKTLATGVTTSYVWNTSADSASLFAQIPNATQGTGNISVTTYNGSTNVGTKTVSFVAYVTNSNPLFTGFTYEDTNSTTITLTGDNQTLINGYSNVETVADQATAQNSSTLARYITQIGSQTNQTTDLTNRTMNINNITSNSIIVRAVDSRGLETAVNQTANWIDYSNIVFNNYTYLRDNDIDDATQFNISGTFWDGNFGASSNSVTTLQYQYKGTNEDETQWSSWIALIPTISDNNFSFSGYVNGDLGATGFDQNKSFNINIQAIDSLSTANASFILGSGTPGEYLEKYSDGTYGYGIGCKPDGTGIWDNGLLLQGIYDSGSNSDGNWIRYVDGTMICYANIPAFLINITSSIGSMYVSENTPLGNYPMPFISTPILFFTSRTGLVWIGNSNVPTTTSYGNIRVFSPTSAPSTNVGINALAIGKWK